MALHVFKTDVNRLKKNFKDNPHGALWPKGDRLMVKAIRKTALLIALLSLVFVATGCGTTVPSGGRGVYFNWRSGTDVSKIYGEGWHWIAPWNRMYIYDVRIKDQQEKLSILTEDQLNISTDLSVRYRPDSEKVAVLHSKVGAGFYEILIRPVIRNQTREVISSYKSIEAYLRRTEIEQKIFDSVNEKLKGKNVVIEAVMLRNMDFPKSVTEAIERKLAMKQEAEKMKFVLEKEKLEAERKSVEAKGIAEFQRIVSEGINENLLRWKGIEATISLAESQNAKVVVVGSGKDGLPLILGK